MLSFLDSSTFYSTSKLIIMSYSIEVATETDKQEVYDFMCNNFFHEMPLYAAFQQTEPLSIDEWPAIQTLNEKISLKAVTSEGRIVGLALNVVPTSGEVVGLPPKLVTFFDEVNENSNSLLSDLEKNHMEIRNLAVAKDWRNRGIAVKLMEESEKLDKKLGGKKIFAKSTGAHIAKAFDKAKWTNVFQYNDSDYKKEPHYQIPPEPHTFLRLYVKDL
ncbi:hypothetical protein LSTR_LSTR002125 [Laodelphax striatellus]|uniref:N-acetyltransferase domain-containing protein n=1 Tax=Laodelphax striatellus TaxID=195883 RepID=A0A482XRG9_LAOST|nr:hypothetical protein LSTR_LSTR002125 [Laodelphax striatellus]